MSFSTSSHAQVPSLGLRARGASLLAALLASGSLLGALLLSFHLSATQPWLQPTPEVMAAVAECRALRPQARQDACMSALVAARTRPPREVRVAAAAAPGAAR